MTVPTFSGSIAENYDQLLGPVIFEPYAIDMARRMPVHPGVRILELAAGTGRVTRRLLDAMPTTGRLVVTDLSAGMLAVAQNKLSDVRLEWRVADALNLPLAEDTFDAVACQFGVMFFPDKLTAYREARRVLKPGGIFVCNAWGGHDRNPWVRVMHRTVQAAFPNDSEPLLVKPFTYNDEATIRATVVEAGFESVELAWVDLPFEAESAAAFARGFATGTPLRDGILERGGDLDQIVSALTECFVAEFGDPMKTTMSALVVTARA